MIIKESTGVMFNFENLCNIIYKNNFDIANEREADSFTIDVEDGIRCDFEIRSINTGCKYYLGYIPYNDRFYVQVHEGIFAVDESASIFDDVEAIRTILADIKQLYK